MTYLDVPNNGPNGFYYWGLFELAHNLGMRVILDGLDGDTTVSHGLAYFRELLTAGNVEAFYAENEKWIGRGADNLNLMDRYLANQTLSQLKVLAHRHKWRVVFRTINHAAKLKGYSRVRIARALLRAEAPEFVKKLWYSVRGTDSQWGKPNYVQIDLAKRVQLDAVRRAADLADGEKALTEKEHHRLRLSAPLMAYTVELTNTFAAAWQLEVRSPFMDKRLIEYSLALPISQKLDQGWTRVVLRRAVEGILPPEIQWRSTKSDLSHNFRRVLLTYERELLEDITTGKFEELNPYIDLSQLRRIYEEYKNGNAAQGIYIWQALSLAVWLRGHQIAEKQ